MPITRKFKETVQARAERDPEFRTAILRESIECMLAGDLKTGKALLRDYINAAVGFEKLSKLTKKDPKSLMRMFSATGNPTAANLFIVIKILQKKENVRFVVKAVH
ncbi:MAG: transcriptional regulator [Candidatus Omnitrophica bacterium]|nr:transcriptional regulator [Candidatus Omnitrophota bacterium]MCB9719889.1 transcriptional regulator [Candidatus Omnitrophota bacterium]